MKKILKSRLFIFILSIVMSAGITSVFAYSIFANDIGFTPEDNTWRKSDDSNVENVSDALNNLLSPMSAINTLSHVGSNIDPAQNLSQAKQIIFNFGAGCVQVDARNKTEKEAVGMMTLALEYMDHVTDVQVDGE